jgi:spore germination protein GerM
MKTRIISAISMLIFIAACNSTFEVGIEHSSATSNAPAVNSTAAQTPVITLAAVVATASQALPSIPVSTDNIAANNSPIPTDTQVPLAATSPQMVKIFVIAVDDNGKTGIPVGCGDSVVPVQVEIPTTQGVLKAALQALLSVKSQYYGQSGLYNALYQSDLQVESVNIDNNGKASVYLTGSLVMGGECDTPRVQAQVEQTVLQFSTVKKVSIFINGKPLADLVSLKS